MFQGILLHASTRRQLEGVVSDPPHALLIVGEEHVGKYLTARSLAGQLFGVRPENLDAHSRYRELSAMKGTIAIEEIRSLLPFFALVVPGKDKVKRVVLIPDADTMTLAAENALLKVLEEPPVGTVIILTTSHPGRLLPTIRSRCQICRVQKPSDEEVRNFLGEYDESAVRNALLIGGTIGAAKQILEAGVEEGTNVQTVKTFLGLPLFEQLIAVEQYSKDREQAAQFVALLIVIAEKGLLKSRSPQWQRILAAALTADSALKKNANVKLTLTELALSLR
jgi:hypothetical protein